MPAAMIFSPSIGGVSHAREEDTSEDDLRVAIEAFGRLANSRLS
jgi:N-carbamoyl-L-amino-acid hydrolase